MTVIVLDLKHIFSNIMELINYSQGSLNVNRYYKTERVSGKSWMSIS